MNRALKIKNGLKKAGKQVYLKDGEWVSTPFFAVVAQKWRSNRSNFEFTRTAAGRVSKDYFTFIGPYDHNIISLSEDARVIFGNEEYIFKKKEEVSAGGEKLFYWGILRKVWGNGDD